MKRILSLLALCASGLVAANPSEQHINCPLPHQTMNAESFRITPTGAVSTVKDQAGRQWSVYIYSMKKHVDKEMIRELINNASNDTPRDAEPVFGAWMCKYEGTKGVLFESSSRYMLH